MNAGVLLVFIAPLFPVSVIEMESKYKIYVQIPLCIMVIVEEYKSVNIHPNTKPWSNQQKYNHLPCMELEVERLSRSPSSRLSDLMSRESSEPVE